MLNETLLRQISDAGDLLGLDEAVIEKDYLSLSEIIFSDRWHY